MMLNEVMQEAINDQINNELFAMYSYMSMSAYCEHKQFRGCAHWMRIQSQEEHVHAMPVSYTHLTLPTILRV